MSRLWGAWRFSCSMSAVRGWTDRSSILSSDDLPGRDSSTAVKVVLLSFDRMRKLPSYPAACISVSDVILFFSSSP